MARRKFHKSTSRRTHHPRTKARSRRRHRVGATALNFSASSPLIKWGSVVLGYLKPDLIPITKLVGDKLDPKIVAGAEVGLGFLLAMRKSKGKKSMIVTVLGGYLLGSGAKKAMTAFGIGTVGPYGRVPVIAGYGPYGRVPVIAGRRMAGYSPNGSLAGYSPSGTINKVMTGVGNYNASGSGLMADNAGSDMMN